MNTDNRVPETEGKPPTLKPLLIKVPQFQSLLQCGRTAAYEMMRKGQVRSVLIGRSRRILLEDAERLVADAVRAAER